MLGIDKGNDNVKVNKPLLVYHWRELAKRLGLC